MGLPATKKYTICGNSVLQNDFLAMDRMLPEVEIGDLITFLNVGAYGEAMASGFPERNEHSAVIFHPDGTYYY